jgi:hypothetical protein
MQVVGSGWW